MFRVKVGEVLFSEASAPSKKAARQLAAEEAVKELMADGKLQLNKVMSRKQNIEGLNIFSTVTSIYLSAKARYSQTINVVTTRVRLLLIENTSI